MFALGLFEQHVLREATSTNVVVILTGNLFVALHFKNKTSMCILLSVEVHLVHKSYFLIAFVAKCSLITTSISYCVGNGIAGVLTVTFKVLYSIFITTFKNFVNSLNTQFGYISP
jgi:hypothetical protein